MSEVYFGFIWCIGKFAIVKILGGIAVIDSSWFVVKKGLSDGFDKLELFNINFGLSDSFDVLELLNTNSGLSDGFDELELLNISFGLSDGFDELELLDIKSGRIVGLICSDGKWIIDNSFCCCMGVLDLIIDELWLSLNMSL